MRLYKIFKDPMNQYEAVKQGWSWPAFFFWAMWACVKQMWGLGIRILVTFVVLSLLAGDLCKKALPSTAEAQTQVFGCFLP